jgi:hypothetical protein
MSIQGITLERLHKLTDLLILVPWQDALLDKHITTGTFDEEIRSIDRPIKSLLVNT